MSFMETKATIKAYHAHLYYQDEEGLALATQVAQQAAERFAIRVGRFHRQAVGPHPVWSCQLSFGVETFAHIVPWLMLNRKGIDVFLHPVTGDDYRDHSQGIAWLGKSYDLDISMFITI